MHDFRRRPEDLKPAQVEALDDLFEKVPALGVIYHMRWQATEIFDTAPDRETAAKELREWIAEARATGLDWQPFITTLENHWAIRPASVSRIDTKCAPCYRDLL